MTLSGTLSCCFLKISSDGDSVMSLGMLCQGLIILVVKNFLLYIKMKPLPVQFVPIAPCPLPVAPCGLD